MFWRSIEKEGKYVVHHRERLWNLNWIEIHGQNSWKCRKFVLRNYPTENHEYEYEWKGKSMFIYGRGFCWRRSWVLLGHRISLWMSTNVQLSWKMRSFYLRLSRFDKSIVSVLRTYCRKRAGLVSLAQKYHDTKHATWSLNENLLMGVPPSKLHALAKNTTWIRYELSNPLPNPKMMTNPWLS